MSFLAVADLRISTASIVLGLIIGMTYGILAVGLILIYRSNKIVNFAHGEIGAFGAAMLALLSARWHVPYWIGFVIALMSSAALALIVELAVIRRLRSAPKIMSIVATLGAGAFILFFSLAIASEIRSSNLFPQPVGLPQLNIGALRVTPAYSAMLFLTPLVVLGLSLFLRNSRYGLAIRGSATNPDRARLSGIYASRMSSLAWAIAGAISAFTSVLILPTRGVVTGEALGPALLMRALVPAVIGRMSNLAVAMIAGLVIGVFEQILYLSSSGGTVEMVLFVAVLFALLLQPRIGSREEERENWTAVQAWKPIPEALSKLWVLRNANKAIPAVLLAIGLLFALLATNRASFVVVSVIGFGLVGLSLAVITGWAGQLSLGQFALAGIGATASYHVVRLSENYLLAFLVAGVVAAGAAVLIGVPALRIRGLMLAVTTLSFALAANTWLFQRSWMLGSGVAPGRPQIGPIFFDTGKKYFLLALGVLILVYYIASNLRRRGIGRVLISIRDNEEAARSFGVPVIRRKLQAFALSGFLAGLGGAIFAHSLANLSYQTFAPIDSIRLVAMAVLGGVSTLAGPLLGSLYIIAIPAFVPLDTAGLAATAFGWFVFILYFPGGIAGLLGPIRERFLDFLSRRYVETQSDQIEGAPMVPPRRDVTRLIQTPRTDAIQTSHSTTNESLLVAVSLSKSFGGVAAIDGVSLDLVRGETLGLIGPNGAGKTTLFDVLSGFLRADHGAVRLDGRDITGLPPEARAHLGLVRSFQDAFLFPTLTVLDTVRLARERVAPTVLLNDLIGVGNSERQKDELARMILHMMGLDAFRNKQIRELSTGTRRVAELASLIALEPKVLLLDEPSSGIAQRETEALGELLEGAKSYLGATVFIIEHDIPLVMGLADRIIAMESGRVIAEGSPAETMRNETVIESYLGADLTAIRRSGGGSGERGKRSIKRKPSKQRGGHKKSTNSVVNPNSLTGGRGRLPKKSSRSKSAGRGRR